MCWASSSCCPSAPLLPTRSLPAEVWRMGGVGCTVEALKSLADLPQLNRGTGCPTNRRPTLIFFQPPTRQVDEVQAAVGARVGDLIGPLHHYGQHLRANTGAARHV